MTAFADSSALVTLYSEEPGRDRARHVLGLAVSDVARVEVPSAFWTKVRTGELAEADAVPGCEIEHDGGTTKPKK